MVSDGTNIATNSYLANSPLVGQIMFKSNTVTRMTTSKQYDYLNRLGSIASTPSNSFTYQYNAANQRTMNQLADGSYWRYGYDALGQVTLGNKYWVDETIVAGQQFDYAFDTIGNRVQTQAGGDQNGANLRLANYTNNVLNQITSRSVPAAVDVLGNGLATNGVTVNGTTAYRKNEYFRQQLSVTNSAAAVWDSITVAATGQTSVTGHAYVPETPESYTYDVDGNLLSDGRWTYAWDAENRLVSLTSLTSAPSGSKLQLAFAYDYMGRRIQKTVYTNNGSSYIGEYTNKYAYDGWNCVAILNPSLVLSNSFMWGSDLSGSIQGAGGVGGLLKVAYYGTVTTNCFVAYDGNGNVGALVNAADGTTIATYEYGPFGEVIRATGPMAKLNPFTFGTYFYDWETDKYYAKNRYYDPSPSKWLSRDPVNEPGFMLVASDDSDDEPGVVPEDNLYAFVANNPVNQIDPLGLAFYAIDGTWTKAKDGANPWQLYMATTENPHFYWRGPRDGPGGADSYLLALAVKKHICKDYCSTSGVDFKINLTGWSRGACIAAEVAQLLNDVGCDCGCGRQKPIPVNWVGLFDAVSMTPGGWVPNSVPPNVAHFYHAVKTKKMFFYPTHHFTGETANSIYNYKAPYPTSHADVGMSFIRNNKNNAYDWIKGTAISSGVGF